MVKRSCFSPPDIASLGNAKSFLYPCSPKSCFAKVEHTEDRLVDVNQYRPFWIQFKEGWVKIGKGGQEGPFLEGNVSAYREQVPIKVHVGISSGQNASGEWVFHQGCIQV